MADIAATNSPAPFVISRKKIPDHQKILIMNCDKVYDPFKESDDSCCATITGGTDTECGCVDDWKKELKAKGSLYQQKAAEAAKKKDELGLAQDWRNKVKTYFDNVQQSAEKADAITSKVKVILDILEKLCKSTGFSVTAIEILFCMTKELYTKVDEVAACYNNISKAIDCSNDQVLKKGGITDTWVDYGKKLQDVIAIGNDIFNNIVIALKAATILDESICEKDYGIKSAIARIGCIFSPTGNGSTSNGGIKSGDDSMEICCTDKLVCPVFPLAKDTYYTVTETQLKNADARLAAIKPEYDKASQEANRLQACTDSLTKAIKQAQDAKACK